jgi:hypothetical protein
MNLRVSPPEPNQTVDNETRRYETYWINSRGDVAVANLGYGLEVPCVGSADAETVAKIAVDVTALLAQPPGEPGGSACPDTEYVYLEIASAGSGMNPQVQIGFAENPGCRRRPIPREMDSIVASVRDAGAAARAVCPATA